ncbi:hypothetical protein [Vibrio cortegadensis]|uniref:hypothetical protein n=1 Tax=Vibrio cortegadensis TaxID=1328770 RepID=UPI00352EDF0C
MKIMLIEGQLYPVTLSAKWLYVVAAESSLSITIESTDDVILLDESAVYHHDFPEMGRVLIQGKGWVEINTGKGRFTPPAKGQHVVVKSMPDIGIKALPPVEMAPEQSLNIGELPPVEIAPDQVIKVSQRTPVVLSKSKAVSAQSSTLPVDLPYRSSRFKVTIKASPDNVDVVLIDGAFPLTAGERIEIESMAAISLTGTVSDRVFILEC